jgi:arginine deiminase
MKTCYVGSEVGRLRRVLVHKPGLSLDRLTPSNCQDLLFDDVLRIDRASREHDAFVSVMKGEGVEVLRLSDLLTDVLAMPEGRQWLLDRQISALALGPALAAEVRSCLETMPPAEMARHLLGGLTWADMGTRRRKLMQRSLLIQGCDETDMLLPPLPNHLFTRDASCWIYGGVSVNPMARPARVRESDNLRAVYRFHPAFSGAEFRFWLGEAGRNDPSARLEGGDVLVSGQRTLMVGLSERTTAQGIELLASRLFHEDVVDRVLVIELPKKRAVMHLDTVLTMMDKDVFTCFPEVINAGTRSYLLHREDRGGFRLESCRNVFAAIRQLLDVDDCCFVPTGGDRFTAEREQWNDANNVLALAPGIVVAYERNIATIRAMEAAGIRVHRIPGDELGRGRGGPRCMSCPVERDDC